MRLSKYHYNPETCRYEPTRISLVTVLGVSILFCVTTVLILAGGLFLHSEFFITEKAQALRKENTAIKKHHASLQRDVTVVETVLENLKQQDAVLHEKLFETPLVTDLPPIDTEEKEKILLADASGFTSLVTILKHKSDALRKKSASHAAHFSALEVTSNDLTLLMSAPSIQPIENTELTKLVSGFGTRINPFHKGNYHHPGADFAAPRGTPVVATGNGKVIDITIGSTLQAGYGNYVEIDHGNGIITRYAHLEEVRIRQGQHVTKGTVIGTVGMSGGTVAPHVHYEIMRDREQVNPVPFMMENLTSTAYAELLKLGNKKNQSLD